MALLGTEKSLQIMQMYTSLRAYKCTAISVYELEICILEGKNIYIIFIYKNLLTRKEMISKRSLLSLILWMGVSEFCLMDIHIINWKTCGSLTLITKFIKLQLLFCAPKV